MADLMRTVREACRNKKLDIPELKTVEGAVALSECMDIMTGLEGEGCDYERAGYAAVALMKYLDSLPLEVFQKDSVGVPAIMERIRKIYEGEFFIKGFQTPLMFTENTGCTTRAFVRYVMEKWERWDLSYDFEKVKSMKENGYSFDWYDLSSIERGPKVPWCEYLRLFPQKSEDLVYSAIRMKRRDILECMKELNALSDAKVLEVMSVTKEERHEFFRSVWYGEGGEAPEIAIVEALLNEVDRFVDEINVADGLPREERIAHKDERERLVEGFMKDMYQIDKIVSQSPEVFRNERGLMKRVIGYLPLLILTEKWRNEKEFFDTALESMERYFVEGTKFRESMYGFSYQIEIDFTEHNTKANRTLLQRSLKKHYPTDEDKRAFIQKNPTCSLVIGFYEVCSQALKEDFVFWIDVYLHAAKQASPPEELCKDQTFLRKCEPIKHIADFGKFYTYETADDLEFVLAHKSASVDLSNVPEEFKTRENIYRILEHNMYSDWTTRCRCLNALDISLFSDEEFVVGAAAYEIDAKEFFLRIDKPLRKVERVWKAWGTKERIEKIWDDIPMVVKKSRTFAEHLLTIGNGVSISGPVFAEMWKNFPDLAEALVDEYVKEIDSKRNSFGNPLSGYEKRERLKYIPDEKLRAIVSKKLFG